MCMCLHMVCFYPSFEAAGSCDTYNNKKATSARLSCSIGLTLSENSRNCVWVAWGWSP